MPNMRTTLAPACSASIAVSSSLSSSTTTTRSRPAIAARSVNRGGDVVCFVVSGDEDGDVHALGLPWEAACDGAAQRGDRIGDLGDAEEPAEAECDCETGGSAGSDLDERSDHSAGERVEQLRDAPSARRRR